MLCNRDNCTGCFACYNICHKNAINMIEDKNGYIFPVIDYSKCVNCKMCEKVCPSLNSVEFFDPQILYAMIAKNNIIRNNSSSGGAAYIISKNIIDNGGIVYGCAFTNNQLLRHVRVEEKKELIKLNGSKYSHSYILDTYKLAKIDLDKNKKVLFIGTPCQIAGLKKYLFKNYDNLYLVDIVCHGVPSQKYLKESLSSEFVDNVTFRNNTKYVLTEYIKGRIAKRTDATENCYYRAFFDGLTYRKNCYDCKYAKKERCSDITLGDFWGLNENSKFYDDKEQGVSLILINTKKGNKLINESSSDMILEKRNIDEVLLSNEQLNHPKKMNDNYYKFKEMYEKYGFNKAYKKIYGFNLLKTIIKNRIKKSDIVYSLYKKYKKKDY